MQVNALYQIVQLYVEAPALRCSRCQMGHTCVERSAMLCVIACKGPAKLCSKDKQQNASCLMCPRLQQKALQSSAAA
eukprot:6198062-Pleurochrysis_carterae.AAC.2